MSSSHRYVLVTGANSGLGLAICKRLVDDFFSTQDETSNLTIIFTTRSSKKGSETLKTLSSHLSNNPAGRNHHRVNFQAENVELTSLLSVKTLAQKLLSLDIPYINTLILNAGIGAWRGLDWPRAVWTVSTGMRQATTWPTFKLGVIGLVTKPQFADTKIQEPPLGEVFCANVFGHYMLAHWLMPLLWKCPSSLSARIMWIGSVEIRARHYNPADHQGLFSDAAYEHTKRICDYLALTSENQPATAKYVKSFLTPSSTINKNSSPPTIHVIQPGVCVTSIVSLYWIIHQAYTLAIYLTRWLGGPWSTVSAYTGAKSATWLTLASHKELEDREVIDGGGSGKWGSGVDRLGNVSIQRTEVDGWGVNGSGLPFKDKWWAGSLGRVTGAVDATEQDVQKFVDEGVMVWKKMEDLRIEWEERIDLYLSSQSEN